MLATSLEGQSAGVDANAGRPLSPRAAQGSPLPVPGAGSVTESQSHSEPIPQIRPHPERIARKYHQLTNILFMIGHRMNHFNPLKFHTKIYLKTR